MINIIREKIIFTYPSCSFLPPRTHFNPPRVTFLQLFVPSPPRLRPPTSRLLSREPEVPSAGQKSAACKLVARHVRHGQLLCAPPRTSHVAKVLAPELTRAIVVIRVCCGWNKFMHISTSELKYLFMRLSVQNVKWHRRCVNTVLMK